MRLSLPTSALLHGALLAWALVGFQDVKPFTIPEPEPVEVSIITEDGITRLKQGDRNSKQLEAAPSKPAPPSPAVKETPKAKPPEPVKAEPPPPPPEPAKAEPPPKPEPPPPAPKAAAEPPPKAEPPPPQKDEIAELAAKAEAEAKVEAERKAADDKRRADAERKAAEDKRKHDLAEKKKRDDAERKRRNEIARKKREEEQRKLAEAQKKDSLSDLEQLIKPALADKDKNRAPQPTGAQVADASKLKGATAGAPEGRDTQLTASHRAMLGRLIKQAAYPCFNVSAGADGIDKIAVEVRVVLRPDGTLAQPPKVVNNMSGPLFAATADAAVRAVLTCAPYRFPPELYKGGWDDSDWNFSARANY